MSQTTRKRSGTWKSITASSAAAPAGSKRLAGKTAIITGAGAGIGAAITRAFAREGANLVLNDIDRSRANESAAAAEQYGVRALVIAGDAGRASVARRMAESGKRVFGAVQILVNNAGVSGSSLGDNTVTTARPGAWEAVLKANLGPVFECSRFAIPLLIKAGGGAVVNISSVLALTGSAEFFRSHGYIASKGAIVSLTRAMAAAYAENNIRVNALCPGLIATAMAERARGRSDLMTYVAQKQKLLRGMGSAEAVAQAALFLTSDEAAEITGVILPIDGGWTSGY